MSILKLAALLSLDGSKFKAGLKEAQGLAGKFSKDVKSQITGAFGYAAIAYASKQMIDYASNVQDTATALDISTNALQEQLYWLTQNSGTIEDLTASYKGLSKARAEALSGDSDKLKTFASVGVSPDALKKLSLEQLYSQSAEGFSNTDFGADKIRVATEIWGKAATSILPALAQSIKAAGKEANDFGQVIRPETISRLEKLGDVASQVGGVWKNAGAELLVWFSRVFTTIAFGLAQIPGLANAMAASIAASIARTEIAIAKAFGASTSLAERRLYEAEERLKLARSEIEMLSAQHADIYDPSTGGKSKGKGAALLEDAQKVKEATSIWEVMLEMEKDEAEAKKKIEDEKRRDLEARLSLEKEIFKVNLQQMSAAEKRAAKDKALQDQLDGIAFLEGQGLDATPEREQAVNMLSDLLDDKKPDRQQVALETNPLTAQGQLGGGRRQVYAEIDPVAKEVQKLLPPTQAMKTAMEALNLKIKGTTTIRSST